MQYCKMLMVTSFIFLHACATANVLHMPDIEVHQPTLACSVNIKHVNIYTTAKDQSTGDRKALEQQLQQSLENEFTLESKPVCYDLSLDYVVTYESYTTVILDFYAIITLGIFPFNVQWGQAKIEVFSTITPTEINKVSKKPVRMNYEYQVPYSIFVYPFFRKQPLEKAFNTAHYIAWEDYRANLRNWLSPFSQVPNSFEPLAQRSDMIAKQLKIQLKRNDIMEQEDRHFHVRYVQAVRINDWHVIKDLKDYHRYKDREPSIFEKYLSALGGIESGYFMGKATVKSQATDSFGENYTIASGEAKSKGYRISMYSIPKKTEFYLYPTLGFLSLDINIEDIAGDIPAYEVLGSTEIPAIASDPTTGEYIDLAAPNVYNLFLRSVALGQRVGGSFVYGTPRASFFFSLEAGLNIVEWRYSDVQLGRYRRDGNRFEIFQSFVGRFVMGFAYRPWHTAVRCEVNGEAYRQFRFPESIPFEGQVEFNDILQTYERKEVFINAAALKTVYGFCGVALYY